MWQLGYAETSAKSLSFERYYVLMQRLTEEINVAMADFARNLQHTSAPSYLFRAAQTVLLLLRDATAFSWQWETVVRAKNSGLLQGENVQNQQGESLLPQLQQQRQFPFATGFRYQFAPNGTKTKQKKRAGVLPLAVKPASDAHLDPLRHLHALIQVGEWRGRISDLNKLVTCMCLLQSAAGVLESWSPCERVSAAAAGRQWGQLQRGTAEHGQH